MFPWEGGGLRVFPLHHLVHTVTFTFDDISESYQMDSDGVYLDSQMKFGVLHIFFYAGEIYDHSANQ